MQRLDDVVTTTEDFIAAAQNIDSFDKLFVVLAHMYNSENLRHQLQQDADLSGVYPPVFNSFFADEALITEDAFGVDLNIAEFDKVMEGIRYFIVPHYDFEYPADQINHTAIRRLAAKSIAVALTFGGAVETDNEAETMTNVEVTFDLGIFKLTV